MGKSGADKEGEQSSHVPCIICLPDCQLALILFNHDAPACSDAKKKENTQLHKPAHMQIKSSLEVKKKKVCGYMCMCTCIS